MRLINADEIKAKMILYGFEAVDMTVTEFVEDELTTVEAEPVRHGHWVADVCPDDGDVRCSRCGIAIEAVNKRHWGCLKTLRYFPLNKYYKYCPHCGAKMDEVEE